MVEQHFTIRIDIDMLPLFLFSISNSLFRVWFEFLGCQKSNNNVSNQTTKDGKKLIDQKIEKAKKGATKKCSTTQRQKRTKIKSMIILILDFILSIGYCRAIGKTKGKKILKMKNKGDER